MDRLLLATLILGISIIGLSIGATVPLVALRLHQLGASSVQVGMMSALPAAGMVLSAFFVDWICHRLNRRYIYLICFTLSAVSVAAIEIFVSNLYALGLARFLMGLAAGFIIILGESWVNEIAENSHRGRVVAIYTSCYTIFQVLGPGMVSLFGITGVLVVSVVFSGHLLALWMIWFSLSKRMTYQEHIKSKAFSMLGFIRVAPALCMGIVFFSFFDSVMLSMFPVYAAERGYTITLAALMVTVILLGDATLQFPLGWLSDIVTRQKLYLASGMLSLAIGLCLPWLMNHPFVLWPSLVVLGAVAGGVYTLAIIMIGERFRGPDLVTANASAGFLWGVGSLLGPLLSGAVMTTSANGLPWALSAAAAVFVAFALQLFKKTSGAVIVD